jgi:hypothetical protein
LPTRYGFRLHVKSPITLCIALKDKSILIAAVKEAENKKKANLYSRPYGSPLRGDVIT